MYVGPQGISQLLNAYMEFFEKQKEDQDATQLPRELLRTENLFVLSRYKSSPQMKKYHTEVLSVLNRFEKGISIFENGMYAYLLANSLDTTTFALFLTKPWFQVISQFDLWEIRFVSDQAEIAFVYFRVNEQLEFEDHLGQPIRLPPEKDITSFQLLSIQNIARMEGKLDAEVKSAWFQRFNEYGVALRMEDEKQSIESQKELLTQSSDRDFIRHIFRESGSSVLQLYALNCMKSDPLAFYEDIVSATGHRFLEIRVKAGDVMANMPLLFQPQIEQLAQANEVSSKIAAIKAMVLAPRIFEQTITGLMSEREFMVRFHLIRNLFSKHVLLFQEEIKILAKDSIPLVRNEALNVMMKSAEVFEAELSEFRRQLYEKAKRIFEREADKDVINQNVLEEVIDTVKEFPAFFKQEIIEFAQQGNLLKQDFQEIIDNNPGVFPK